MKITSSLVLLLVLPFISISSFAAGDYDGIWETSVGGYASITQNGNSVVAVSLEPLNLEWEAFQGDLVNNSVTMLTVVGVTTASIRLDFTSTSSMQITVISCAPVSECDFSPGTQFTAVKIF